VHTEHINHKGRNFVHVAEEIQLFTVKVTITENSMSEKHIVLFECKWY
jgi:hypothetical protein